MAKKILHKDDARAALMRGVDAVADAVRITIGPRGRNVAFDKGYGAPTITNDGVSIAKEISLPDKFENMGAEIVKEVATKTNDSAGDGTTTSIVLTQSIMKNGLEKTSMGANGLLIRRGIEAAAKDAISALRKMAKPIKNKTEIKQVATISAENEEIGAIIAETIEKVGKDGVVTVEESQSFGVDSDVVLGISFDKGYVSPYMITNTERMEAEYKNPLILITDKKISTIKEILPLLEKVAESGKKELVIIADDIDGEALTTFVVNKLRGSFNVLAIKAPGFGDRKKDVLEDIAVTVGAKVITESTGLTLEKTDIVMLGRAARVVSKKDETVIVGGKGKKSDIDKRIAELKSQKEGMSAKYGKFDIEKINERIAKLSGGVAVIRVGAATETEMKYLKLKIEDAVNATRAAIEEGIVPGGGSVLVKVARAIASKGKKEIATGYDAGYESLVKSLYAPMKQILVNAGYDDTHALIIDKVAEGGAQAGYDASQDEVVEDMFKAGIIDPVKVTRTALENAASAAGILLTTDVAIADIPEDKKDLRASERMEY